MIEREGSSRHRQDREFCSPLMRRQVRVSAQMAGTSSRRTGPSARTAAGRCGCLIQALLLWVQLAPAMAQEPVIQPAAPSPAAQAQPPAAVRPADAAEATIPLANLVQQLQQRIASGELEQAVRDRYSEQLQAVTRELQETEEHRQNLAQVRSRLETLAAEAEQLRTAAPPESAEMDVTETETPQLETQLATLQVRVTEEQQRLTGLQQRVSETATTRQTLQSQIGKLTTDIAELPAANGTPDTESLPLEQAVAELERISRRDHLRAELNLLQTRLSMLDAESSLNLPQLRAAAQERLVARVSRSLTAVREELEIRRKVESESRLQQAQRDQRKITDPALRDLVQRTAELAAGNNQLVQQDIPHWREELSRTTQRLQRVRDEGDKLRSRIDRFGTSGVVGVELLRYQQNLPSISQIERLLEQMETQQTQLEFDRLDYQEELTEAEDSLQRLAESDDLEARNLWTNKVELLRSMISNNMSLFSILADLNAESRTLLTVIRSWQDYVSVQAFWFRSQSPLSWTAPATAGQELRQVSRTLWSDWTSQSVTGVRYTTWLVLVPAVAVMLALIAGQRRARAAIDDCAEWAQRRSCVMLTPTIRALLLTAIVAAGWPLLLVLIGMLLQAQMASRSLVGTLGEALLACGCWFLLFNFLRQTLRPNGLGEAHFGWDPAICRAVRNWLRTVFLLLALPAVLYRFLRAVPEECPVALQLTYMGVLLTLVLLLWRLHRTLRQPVLSARLNQLPVFSQYYWLWGGLGLLLPLFLATLSGLGFQYTAAALALRLVATVSVWAILTVVYALLLRWLKVRRTRTALQLARERAAQREKALVAEGEAAEAAADSSIPQAAPPEVDFEVLGVQARALIRSVMLIALASIVWAIWSEVLPALRVLSEYPVWQIAAETAVVSQTADGASVTQTRITMVSVTVGDLLFAAIAALLTFVGVRFLPGFVEVMLLSRGAFDAGVRYAIITLTRYVLLLAGVVLVCQTLGVRWNSVQWLAAGLSVGLGFGLQEVFANFVSGLIILFERPVRIGDIVTIDGVTGVVSRIRIRATSITDWDRREYIVPNREFVTGKLLNWTLSDTTNRFVLTVGVGYGSDTVRAREIMLEVAAAHPNILKDPAPSASLEGFGESSLTLCLRVFLPNMESRLATISDLHTEILRRFAEAGIDIPYPQRAVHLVSDGRLPASPSGRPAS